MGDPYILLRFTTYEEFWFFVLLSVTTSSLIAQLTARAYLALMLNSTKLDGLLNGIAEDIALEILAALTELSLGVRGSSL